jgi:hypothetical protein
LTARVLARHSRIFDELEEDEDTSIRLDDLELLAESIENELVDPLTADLEKLLAAAQAQAKDGNDPIDFDELAKTLESATALPAIIDDDALPRKNADGTLARDDDDDDIDDFDVARLSEDADVPIEPLDLVRREYLIKEVLRVRRHVNVTAKGRVQSFSAIVVVGDGQVSATQCLTRTCCHTA